MAQYKDVLGSNQIGQMNWIHDLARGEVHPDADRLLSLGKSFDPQQLVEESTIDFLTALREQFNEYARVFNVYSENGTKFQEIKVYSLAQTAADFMVFRNQIKLVVANTAHGVIEISYSQHNRSTLAVDGQVQSTSTTPSEVDGKSTDILAQVGPFRDVFWTFQGEKVQPEQIARFYFAEFARATRDAKKSRASNQLLLDQIKALLEEKGLNL